MQIADAHNDLLMTFKTGAGVFRYLNFCRHNEVVKLFTAYYYETDKNISDESLILDISKNFNQLKSYDFVVPTFENIDFVKNEYLLQKFINFEPFCATLTWNSENCLAGGSYSKGRLTGWGKRVVLMMTKNNILVDFAHLNEASFWDVAEIQDTIFCSHTASFDVYPINRNLNKKQLCEIKARHGFVGLCLYNTLLTANSCASFDDVYRHLDNLLEFAGQDCVGWGSDFNGTKTHNPCGIVFDYLGMKDLYNYLLKYYQASLLNKVFYQNLLNFENKIKRRTNPS